MIKVVSFDIGGTLLRKEDPNGEKYNLKALAELINLPYDDVRHAYKDVYQKRNKSFDDLLKDFCNILNTKETKELREFFQNKFNVIDDEISKEDLKLLKEIKKNGYKVILLSNNCVLINSSIQDSVKGIVDKIFYSYDLGYTKSDKELYHIVEEKLNCKPDEFLHVGDTLKSDYLKPLDAGWHAIYYGNPDNNDIEYILELSDIMNYLKK